MQSNLQLSEHFCRLGDFRAVQRVRLLARLCVRATRVCVSFSRMRSVWEFTPCTRVCTSLDNDDYLVRVRIGSRNFGQKN